MNRQLRWLATLLLSTAVLSVPAAPASADHIRAMTVYQVAGSATSNEVTIRVDFNYSGNCCGGYFSWQVGEVPDRFAGVPDGIENGDYTVDVAPTTGTFSDGSTYEWTRYRPDPAVPLVRIDITWTYYTAGSYVVTWSDCCPQSNNTTLVVAGQPFQPRRILTADTGSATVPAAYAQAAIPVCGAVMNNEPLCYELLNSAQLGVANLNAYSAMLVPSEAPAAIVTALGLRENDVDAWLRGGRGLAVYGQGGADFTWVPTGGQVLTAVSVLANDVSVTATGMTHTSHLNQLPTVGPVNGTLAGWNVSTYNEFPNVPSYFQYATGTALAARSGTGATVAVAGRYDGTSGCEVVTGQPIDEKAATRPGAQHMFRSTLEYALTCVDPARV